MSYSPPAAEIKFIGEKYIKVFTYTQIDKTWNNIITAWYFT
jgi:hypothetical protein